MMAEEGASSAVVVDDTRSLIRRGREQREGDVISPHRAVLTLSKSMFNAGCFSLPFAWRLGGKWVSLILTFVIAGFNWYGNHILVRSSQSLAKKHGVQSLDYGHFAKRVCEYSSVPWLQREKNSKAVMYIVNITILFYQLGMCSVAILFITDNMVHLLGDYVGGTDHFKTLLMASIATVIILFTNMFTQMRIISIFAMVSSIFFLMGTAVIMQYAIQQPSQWDSLPGYTNFTSTIMFAGMSMYAFEGQTMILPIENKLATPEDFLDNFGVLPTTMMLCTIFMTAIGLYGYNAFGEETKPTITVNVPRTGLYSSITSCLIIQSILGHSIAMYVVFDMFFKGFRRKFRNRFPSVHESIVDKGFRCFWVLLTYFMAILVPKLELMIPLVGVTSGTLCALVYPPLFQLLCQWEEWKVTLTPMRRNLQIGLNFCIIIIGFFAIGSGITANILSIMQTVG